MGIINFGYEHIFENYRDSANIKSGPGGYAQL